MDFEHFLREMNTKPDYNTNAGSYYKDLARKQELIKLLAKKIWEYEELLDESLENLSLRLESYINENDLLMTERLKNWDERIENLDDEVSHIFIEWLNDGTLEQIINHDVLGNKADKVDLDKVNTKLSQITDINVEEFLLDGETTYDMAIQRAIDSGTEYQEIKLTFPIHKEIRLNHVRTRRRNLTVSAYGATFIPTNQEVFMWEHSGDNFHFYGGFFRSESSGTYRGLQVKNDDETINSNFSHIKDVTFYDLYQALDMNMIAGIGGASYRHTVENVNIQKDTNRRTQGSYGLRMGGNGSGDSAGNDSKIINTFIKGYEKNLIIQNSIGTKVSNMSNDAGTIAVEIDGGSHHTFVQSYLEYNETVFNFVNTPYRVMIIGSTYAHYTTLTTGALLSNELILDFTTMSPMIKDMSRNLFGGERTLTRVGKGHGGGFWIDNNQKALDFTSFGEKTGLVPSDDMDMYYSVKPTKRIKMGNIEGSSYSDFDDNGIFYPKQIVHTIVTMVENARPWVSNANLFKTANTIPITITAFRGGVVGQQITINVDDTNTIIANGVSIVTKTRDNLTPQKGDVLTFVCFDTDVFYQV